MPAKSKGKGGNDKPVRRSGRKAKQKNFGSDFEMDDPKSKKVRKEPDPDPEPGPDPVPPLPQLPVGDPVPGTSADPDPTPAPGQHLGSPEKLHWDSDPEHWRNSFLLTNHSKHFSIFVSDRV